MPDLHLCQRDGSVSLCNIRWDCLFDAGLSLPTRPGASNLRANSHVAVLPTQPPINQCVKIATSYYWVVGDSIPPSALKMSSWKRYEPVS